MNRNWYLLFTVFVWALVQPQNLFAQSSRVLVIEENEIYDLKKSLITFDKIFVKGTLKVHDKRKIKIETSSIIIDGGTLVIGTSEHPRRNELSLSFRNVLGLDKGIQVINEGNLYLNGSVQKDDSLNRTIRISSVNQHIGASIQIENAKSVRINNVRFEKLGYVAKPVFNWKGNTQEGFVNNCIFKDNQGQAFILKGTNIVLQGNHIETQNASAIVCRNMETAKGNQILNNTIFTKSSDSLYAIVANNPYQKINNNRLILSGNASGIRIAPDEEDSSLNFEVASKTFSLDGNVIKASNLDLDDVSPSKTTGIVLSDFGQRFILKVTNNTVSNLSIGAIVMGKNYLFDGFSSHNNEIGVYPGKSYLSNSRFKMDKKTGNSKAIVANEQFGTVAPKISNIVIDNYDIGIHFEGNIQPSNYIEKISFVDAHPVTFASLSSDSYILDRDGSLSIHQEIHDVKSTVGHQHHAHHKMDGMDHKSQKESSKQQRTLFYPNSSMLISQHSKVATNDQNIFKSEEQLAGVLTISTGFGLSDPVHEHNRSFEWLQIEQKGTGNLRKIDKNSTNENFFLAANTNYNLTYENKGGPLYDIGFEWEAAPNTWVIISLPYSHRNPVALRSFGALIQPSKSLNELHNALHTTYFIDEEKNFATLKLYNKQHLEEFVLYSRSILTEISLDNKKVPIELLTDWDKNEVLISFETPKDVKSRLDVLDYYGNVVTTLFNGITKKENTTSSLDIDQFDVQKKIFRYSLTVDGKNHKGPIYAY